MTTDIQVTKDESGQITIHGVREVAERIVSDMSRSGFPVDEEYLERLEAYLREQVYRKLQRIPVALELAKQAEVYFRGPIDNVTSALDQIMDAVGTSASEN
jgi:hypothetical protein